MLRSRQTCDPEMSSRAWRSSPCSPRSPSPVRSARGLPAPLASLDPGLFQRVEVAALARGTAMTIQPQDPEARSAGALDETTALVEPALRTEPPRLRFDPPSRSRPPDRSARTSGVTTRTSRGTALACTATARPAAEADQEPRRCRPSDAAVRHARHLPLQGRHPDRAGHRSRPVRERPDLGPESRRMREAPPLLHRHHRLEVPRRADARPAQRRDAAAPT